MISPEIWIPQIVRYAALVADDRRLQRAWVEHDYSDTSVTNYDELFVQVFDDQDTDNLEAEMVALLDHERRQAISRFLAELRGADRVIDGDPRYADMSELLRSDTWRGVQHAARGVVAAFAARPWPAAAGY